MFYTHSSSWSISSSGRRCPDVSAKLMPVLRHSACCCHRTKCICDVFLSSLSWLSSASFPGYYSLHYCLLMACNVEKVFLFLTSYKSIQPVRSLVDEVNLILNSSCDELSRVYVIFCGSISKAFILLIYNLRSTHVSHPYTSSNWEYTCSQDLYTHY